MHVPSILGAALAATLVTGILAAGAAAGASAEEDFIAAASSGPSAKLGPWLANVAAEYQNSSNKRAFRSSNSTLKVRDGMVGVDLYANDAAGLQRSLAQLGARNIKSHGPLVSAQVPVSALNGLAALPSLRYAMPSLAKVQVASQGDVVSQGDVSLRSNTVRASTGLDGSGITVGVMSDSYRCNPPPFVPGAPTTTAAQDEASQDAPPGVDVLDNGACPGSDEGRGMVQLVHDVAPGAAQKFHSAFNSLVDFADGILELQEAGADVIVDDVIYFAENMFSDGIVAQAADLAVQRGAAYFSSAGNQARMSYESEYREVPVRINGGGNNNGKGAPFVLPAQDFDPGPGVDTLQKVHVTPDGKQALIVFSLQWDQPFLSSTAFAQATDPNGAAPRGATGDLDMLIYNDKGVLVPRCPPGVATGITCQLEGTRNIGGDAVDLTLLFVGGPKSKTNDFFVRIARVGGEAPAHVKYVVFEQQGTLDVLEHDTQSGTAYGHANAANVASIGASSFYLTEEFDAYFSTLVQDAPGACVPACLNDFSSAGGIPIYLDKYGARLATPALRPNPRVTGPDGGNTTFFLADSSFDDDDGDGCNSPTSTFITPCLDDAADELPNFFGTSASAPHVAAVAALMLQKNGGLAANSIYTILRNTSQDIKKREVEVIPGPGNSVFSALPAGYDFDSGQGFVDAAAAVAATPNP
ncbi:MAG TPA: S8 family serine peptidase [Steroidobacteraceae bacterium]|nr:S8 family serine peptidase [Steroidobacteraceae bacterium]